LPGYAALVVYAVNRAAKATGQLNFLSVGLSYFLSFRLVQAESLMACFVVVTVTDVQPEIRPEVTGKVLGDEIKAR
jgi:hypothetical protein